MGLYQMTTTTTSTIALPLHQIVEGHYLEMHNMKNDGK